MKPQMLSPGLRLVPVEPQGHRASGGGLGLMLQLHPWCCGARALVPLGPAWNAWCCRGQWGQSLKLPGEEAQGAVLSRAKQGIWRSMVLSAENRREKQPALVKLAGTFGEKSVILEQLTIKEHSPATIFHPNYFSDPPLRHVRCMFINKVNTQIPSHPTNTVVSGQTPQPGEWEALQQLLKSLR